MENLRKPGQEHHRRNQGTELPHARQQVLVCWLDGQVLLHTHISVKHKHNITLKPLKL